MRVDQTLDEWDITASQALDVLEHCEREARVVRQLACAMKQETMRRAISVCALEPLPALGKING